MDRLVRFDVFLGMNGSGKSYQMAKWCRTNTRNLILPATRADKVWKGIPELKYKAGRQPDPFRPGKGRDVLHYPEINTFQGNRVIYLEGTDRERQLQFDAIIHPNWGFQNGGFFMDDAKRYIHTNARLPHMVREFFGNRRQNRVDIFLAGWQAQDINSDFWGFGGMQLWIGNIEREPTQMLLDNHPNAAGVMAAYRKSRAVNATLPPNQRWYFEPYPNPPLGAKAGAQRQQIAAR